MMEGIMDGKIMANVQCFDSHTKARLSKVLDWKQALEIEGRKREEHCKCVKIQR